MSNFLDKLGGTDKLKPKNNLSSKELLLGNSKINEVTTNSNQEIIIPETVANYQEVQQIAGPSNSSVTVVKPMSRLKKNNRKKSIPIKDIVIQEIEDPKLQEVVEDIQEELVEVSQNIPDLSNHISFEDVEIVEAKSRKGYTKTTVVFKNNTPKELSTIATYARKFSDNIIKPRTMNILNINNVNKTQLRSSQIKLGKQSYTFKPDSKKLKVPKFKRFILSIFDDFSSTREITVYIQDSRSKFVFITKINNDDDLEFLGKLIFDFYFEGFEVVKRKLQFKNTVNPLLRAVSEIVKTKTLKVKPIKVDEDNQSVGGLLIKSTTGSNPWLNVIIQKSNTMSGLYDIYMTSDFDESWKVRLNNQMTSDKSNHSIMLDVILTDKFLKRLEDLFKLPEQNFKRAGLNLQDNDTKSSMLLNKLKYRATRQVLIDLINYIEDTDNKNNIEIVNTYSQLEAEKLIELGKSNEYKPELIIIKSKDYQYVLISYFAMEIVGGDKRAGRDYITTNDYYDKYKVSDRSEYQNRRRTILTRQLNERNYNARPYMFQCEYKQNNKEYKIVAKTFKEINDKLNIF